MSKEGFSWKSLFVNDENQSQSNTENTITTSSSKPQEIHKFPESAQSNSTSIKVQESVSTKENSENPFLQEVLSIYEKGFESLNQPEFDFFELYKSVMAVGANNSTSYQMAFAMGQSIKPGLSKEFLLEKSKFYISEIESVYNQYDSTGKTKKRLLSDGITKQKEELNTAIIELESKIMMLRSDFETKKAELDQIDNTNKTQFSEIQMKIDANDLAKRKILDSINVVVSGINQYL